MKEVGVKITVNCKQPKISDLLSSKKGEILEFDIEAKVKKATEGAMRKPKGTEGRSRKTRN